MKKRFVVQFAENVENVDQVQEWISVDDNIFEAETPEDAAMEMSYTDGLEDAFFRVYQIEKNEYGDDEQLGDFYFFNFSK